MPILKMTDEEWECISGCACECGYEYVLEEIIELKDHTPVENVALPTHDNEPKKSLKIKRLKKVKKTSD